MKKQTVVNIIVTDENVSCNLEGTVSDATFACGVFLNNLVNDADLDTKSKKDIVEVITKMIMSDPFSDEK